MEVDIIALQLTNDMLCRLRNRYHKFYMHVGNFGKDQSIQFFCAGGQHFVAYHILNVVDPNGMTIVYVRLGGLRTVSAIGGLSCKIDLGLIVTKSFIVMNNSCIIMPAKFI